MSRRDPESGCGCLFLIGAATLVALVALALVDVRLVVLWLVAGAIFVVVLDTLVGPSRE